MLRFRVPTDYRVFFASRRNGIHCQRFERKLYFNSGFLCNSFASSWPYWPKHVANLCKIRAVFVKEVILFGLFSEILEDIRELSAVDFEEPERCA